jgi:ABC-type multidrug transport system fused ATPase/permease subunit
MSKRAKIDPIPWKLVRRTLSFLGAHRVCLATSIVSTVIVAVVWFAGPYFLRRLTDTAIAGQWGLFAWMVAASFGFAVLEVGFGYMKRVSVTKLSALTIRDIRNRLTRHMQMLPMSTVETYHSGDLVSRLNNDLQQTASLYQRVPDYLHQPLQFIGGLLFMFLINPKLTLVICAAMPISVLVFERVVRPMQQHSGKKMESLAAANVSLQDAIRGASVVRAFNLQKVLNTRFQQQAEEVEKHDMKNRIRGILSFVPFLTLRYIPQLLVPIYGGLLAFRGEITVGELLAVNLLIWPVFLPLESFLGWIREVREVSPALKRTYDILDHRAERMGGRSVVPTQDIPPIVCDSVSFAYGDHGHVLNQLSMSIEPGKTIALVGASGCGKTTLLKLLCGWITPIEGDVRIFGESIETADLISLRKQISWMAQDPFLFPASISQNIAYGREGVTQNDVIAAAKAASAHEFICALPGGYSAQAGELGSRLSGGQKQRICLARMILKDSPILLLDEPTASLDTQSEAEVLDALGSLMADKTVVIISHRLSSLRGVDEILVVDAGSIRARGTHDELIASDALYRQFVERQVIKDGNHVKAGGSS